jgi:hypothetical protein
MQVFTLAAGAAPALPRMLPRTMPGTAQGELARDFCHTSKMALLSTHHHCVWYSIQSFIEDVP